MPENTIPFDQALTAVRPFASQAEAEAGSNTTKAMNSLRVKQAITAQVQTIPGEPGPKGDDGLSAYEVWLAEGNSGTEQDFLDSLKGADGEPGTPGLAGDDGLSAYEVWLAEGNSGTEEDYFNWVKDVGVDSEQPTNNPTIWVDTDEDEPEAPAGMSAYEVWLSEGNSGTEQDFFDSLKGDQGVQGLSAYEVWLDEGNSGTEEDYFNYLKNVEVSDSEPVNNETIWIDTDEEEPTAPAGMSAYEVWLAEGNSGTEQDFFDSLKGDQGIQGEQGIPGVTALRQITAATTITIDDFTIEVTANTFTQPLPTAVGFIGRIYNIKNSGTGIVTVDAEGMETIDGELTQHLSQYENLTVQSNGTNWIIL